MEPEEQETLSIAPLQEAIQRLLSDHYQTGVALERAILLTDPERRNRLWRCHLKTENSGVPVTVIIKQVKPDAYDPATPATWDTSRFFRDWAGAQFLSAFAREEGHGPAFYGGNIELGFIVIEDMGEHASLVEPLLKGDASAASEALLAFAERLGRMHAVSIGKEERYREIQREISPAWAALDARSSDSERDDRAKQVAAFAQLCACVDVEAGEAAGRELDAALTRLAAPGPFTALLHGDPCPDNVFYHAPELRLIDFEFSRFGHALRDGLYGRLPFPTCWCASRIPAEVVRQMETTYRAELAVACPEAQDDRRFAREACAVAASWTLESLQWHLEDALKEEAQWGIAGVRARLLSRIEMFLDMAQEADQMPALRGTYEKVLAQLHRRWPEAAPLPLYPAFRPGTDDATAP